MRAIRPTLARLPGKDSALEIGTGTGVFLECLLEQGFNHLEGVEPSSAAIANAPQSRRLWIHESIFIEEDFQPESFDLICCFMTMEHVLDPGQVAHSVMRLLRPGGAFVTVTHDYRSLVNRAMGKRSPIIDVEHMQLFSKRSIQQLFETCGYGNVQSIGFANSYALRYWVRLLPLPPLLKKTILTVIGLLGITETKIKLNVGNIMTSAYKKR
jgi:SAM-dependent methyltransferase